MPEFYIMFARKKIFSGIFWGVVGEGNPLAFDSYAYGWAPGPPPAKSGPGERGGGVLPPPLYLLRMQAELTA